MMRRAAYDLKQVICRNSSSIGHSSNVARPGYWVAWKENGAERIGRALGRVADTDRIGNERHSADTDCRGFLAVVRLSAECTHAGIAWVDPATVTRCYALPPAQLLAWVTGAEWVKSKADIARIVAMSEHGTLSESFIATRDDFDKAYNARPGYVAQFILKD